jgi:SAM-dependent methyltransferase
MKINPTDITYEPSKKDFVETWGISGYRENFEVYERQKNGTEEEVVSKCLSPWFDGRHTALEIGCGGGFWVEKYLCPNFKHVYGLDLLPAATHTAPNFTYIEVPDKDYTCYTVKDNSIDFVWSFGVFCHLNLLSIQTYLNNVYRVLKSGGHASLYFSNDDRLPNSATVGNPTSGILWIKNNLETSTAMLHKAGLVEVTDVMPHIKDTVLHVVKP